MAAQYKFEVGQTYEGWYTITARTESSVTINGTEYPVKMRNTPSGDEIEFAYFINGSLSAKKRTA